MQARKMGCEGKKSSRLFGKGKARTGSRVKGADRREDWSVRVEEDLKSRYGSFGTSF